MFTNSDFKMAFGLTMEYVMRTCDSYYAYYSYIILYTNILWFHGLFIIVSFAATTLTLVNKS